MERVGSFPGGALLLVHVCLLQTTFLLDYKWVSRYNQKIKKSINSLFCVFNLNPVLFLIWISVTQMTQFNFKTFKLQFYCREGKPSLFTWVQTSEKNRKIKSCWSEHSTEGTTTKDP